MRFQSPPSGLAIQNRSLWVSLASDGVLLRLDARSGRRLGRIDVNAEDRRALGGGTLARGAGYIWVAAPVRVDDDPVIGNASGWIGRIDPSTPTLRITQTYGDPPSHVAVSSAGVWVSGGRTLRRVSVRTGRVIKTLRLPGFLGGIAVDADTVWVNVPSIGVVLRVDARTYKLIGSTAVGRSTAGSAVALDRGVAWVATDRGIVALDRTKGTVMFRLALPPVSAVAVDGPRVWALASDGLYTISGRKVSKRAALGPNTAGLLAAAGGVVWVSDGASNTLRRARI